MPAGAPDSDAPPAPPGARATASFEEVKPGGTGEAGDTIFSSKPANLIQSLSFCYLQIFEPSNQTSSALMLDFLIQEQRWLQNLLSNGSRIFIVRCGASMISWSHVAGYEKGATVSGLGTLGRWGESVQSWVELKLILKPFRTNSRDHKRTSLKWCLELA